MSQINTLIILFFAGLLCTNYSGYVHASTNIQYKQYMDLEESQMLTLRHNMDDLKLQDPLKANIKKGGDILTSHANILEKEENIKSMFSLEQFIQIYNKYFQLNSGTNQSKAELYLYIAAIGELKYAQENLSDYLLAKKEKDYVGAAYWYIKSARNGNEDALFYLNEIGIYEEFQKGKGHDKEVQEFLIKYWKENLLDAN